MIEGISDAVQLVVVAACFALALLRSLSTRNTTWLSLVCFFACMLLGNAYWFGYLVVFGEAPRYSYIADLSWVAGYVFLLMIVVEADQQRGLTAPVPAAWLPVAFCAACCIFYIVDSGSPLLNIADNGLLAALGFFAVRDIVAKPPSGEASGGSRRIHLAYNKAFHWSLIAFIAVEQAVWLASCFLEPGPILVVDPYIVLSNVLTLSYVAILACAWRSDEA